MSLEDYKRDQDLFFADLKRLKIGQTVKGFTECAAMAGYTVDDLLWMLDRWMTVAEISKAVFSNL